MRYNADPSLTIALVALSIPKNECMLLLTDATNVADPDNETVFVMGHVQKGHRPHLLHATDPEPDQELDGHILHELTSGAALCVENVPASHATQPTAPAGDQLPGSHDVQPRAPNTSDFVPFSHGIHEA